MSYKWLATCCFLFVILVLVVYVAQYGFDVSAFIAAPEHLVACSPKEFEYIRYFQNGGSDGGYNYLASIDPLLQTYKSLPDCAKDALFYTKERFLYHFISWAVVLGMKPYIHYGMLFTNIVMMALISFYTYRLCELKKISRWILVVLILSPGIWQPLRFNLVDLTWDAFAIASIYYYETQNRFKLSLSLLASLLVRSFSIGLIVAFVVTDFLAKRRKIKYYLTYALPLIIFYGPFKYWQRLSIPQSPKIFVGEGYLQLPLESFVTQASELLNQQRYLSLFAAMGGVLLVLMLIGFSIMVILKTRKLHYEAIIVIGFSFMLLVLNNIAWSNSLLQLSRVSIPSFICLVLLLNKYDPKYLRVVIPSLYLVSFYGIIWMLFAPKQVLLSWIYK